MKISSILLFAFLIRLLISPLFFHPDIKDIHLRVSFLGTDGILNIYDFLENNTKTKVDAPDFVYPPLTYFFLGGYQILIKPLLGNSFDHWLFDFSGLSSLSEYIYRYLLLLKLPYMIFDFSIAYLLCKFLDKEKIKTALFFWLFNPLNLYAVYAIGQFDIIPAFFTFLSFYLWTKKSYVYSGLSLGIGAAFKTFPLLIIPFFLFTSARWKDKLLWVILSVGIYGVTLLPFLSSPAFAKNVLFSGLSQRIFQMQVTVAGFNVSVFLLLYAGLVLAKLLKRSIPLWALILSVFLLVFSVSRFHPQWVIWVMPFLTLAFVLVKIPWWNLVLLWLSYFAIFILFGDKFLTTALLAPISPIFLEIPPFTQLISQDKLPIVSFVVQIIFGFSSLVITFKALKSK